MVAYSQAQVRNGLLRVSGAFIPNLQAAILATASFMLCWKVLGLVNPIFAPIVTYLCMGFSRNREPRKVIEFGLGATAGVFLGSVVTHWFGFGWWQMLVLLIVGPLLGRFIDRSDIVTFQTGINAIVLAALIGINEQGEEFSIIERLVPAIVGALVALIATILIPSNMVSRPRRYIGFAIGETSRALRRLSKGLLDGDYEEISRLRGLLTGIREVLSDADAAKRASAAEGLSKAFAGKAQTMAMVMNTVAADKALEDKWRGFKRPADSRHLGNEVDGESVDESGVPVSAGRSEAGRSREHVVADVDRCDGGELHIHG